MAGASVLRPFENRGFLEGDKFEVAVKNGRWVLNHLPARPRSAVEPIRHYFDAV